jgi:flagellar biosynthesis/type III secretory pathway protein FliH
MILSDPLSSVSWRLNELLKAGKKARAFAKSPWGQSEQPSEVPPFSPLQPKSLDTLPEGARETESLDLHEEEQAQPGEDVTEQEIPEAQDTPPPVLPQFSQEAMDEAQRVADAKGYERGLEEGNNQWREAREAFLSLVDMFRSAQANTDDFYAPLKQLSLHLAEELVRGELALSSTAVERLVKGILKDLQQQGEGPLIIYLNPLDLEHFSLSLDDQQANIELRADQQLSRGSVRVNMDDSAVEDLIEHRLETLTDSLLGLGSRTVGEGVGEYKFAVEVAEKVIEAEQINEQANSESESESESEPEPDSETGFLDQQSADGEIDSEDKSPVDAEEQNGQKGKNQQEKRDEQEEENDDNGKEEERLENGSVDGAESEQSGSTQTPQSEP